MSIYVIMVCFLGCCGFCFFFCFCFAWAQAVIRNLPKISDKCFWMIFCGWPSTSLTLYFSKLFEFFKISIYCVDERRLVFLFKKEKNHYRKKGKEEAEREGGGSSGRKHAKILAFCSGCGNADNLYFLLYFLKIFPHNWHTILQLTFEKCGD